jgi:putative component of membrane protein insertase Oxa1/YidC/SpoIIIJ protein YidD
MTPLARLAVWAIGVYKGSGGGRSLWVECNFTPSCSDYAREAIVRHGAWRGFGLARERISRCRQREQVGTVSDPVPERLAERMVHELE